MRDAALRYASRGWHVLPIIERGKTPANPHGLLEATTDTKQIEAWWAHVPYNIAIRTGAVSGIVVVDADAAHGGMESLSELTLPETTTVLTGGGGLHYYYAHPGYEVRNAVGIQPGIDIRGDGGYVVAPPSIHPGGGPYLWEVLHDDNYPLAIFPKLSLAAPKNRSDQGGATGAQIPHGQRNTELASLAGAMRRRGMLAEEIFEALRAVNARCLPPLGERELQMIASSVGRYVPAVKPIPRGSRGFPI